jgi:hypothetical protein
MIDVSGFTESSSVNLPKEERAKFSLVAVGLDMMRRLVDDAG